MGLLNFLPEDDAKKAAMRQGLLQFGAEMLAGRGNFGTTLGQGLGAGVNGYSGALQQAQKDQLEAAQLKLLQGKDTRAQALQDTISRAFGGAAPSQQATQGKPPVTATAKSAPTSAAPEVQGSAPFSHGEAQAAFAAAERDGLDTSNPSILNELMIKARQNSGTPANATQQVEKPLYSGAPTPAPAPARPAFPLTLDQVSQIKAMGGPDLSQEYKMANEGFKRDQGSSYIMPNGTVQSYAKLDNGQVQGADGTIRNANGYTDSMVTNEAAKAAAIEQEKAKYDLLPLNYVDSEGRPIGGTRGSYVAKVSELPKVGNTPPARPTLRPVTPPGFPVVTPAQQQQRDGTRLDILRAERAKATDPADIAALDREIGGTRGAPVLQSATEAQTQRGNIETTQKAGQELNNNWIKDVHNPVQAEGKAARTTLTQLETIKNVNFETGWGAEAKAGAANVLASLGVKDAQKYAGNAQKFQQVAMERNMTQLAAQAGPQTEGDSTRAQQTFLKLSNTPAANQFIADLTAANARVAMKKAEYYNKALPLAKQKGDLTEIDRRWSNIAPSVWSDPQLAKYKVK